MVNPSVNPSSDSAAVVGVGAVGGVIAASLCEVGLEPLLAVRQPFPELSHTVAGTTARYTAKQVCNPAHASEAKWVFLCTKAYQTAAVGAWLTALCAADTTVAVLQNGIQHAKRLQGICAPQQVLPVVVQMACERDAPGQVTQTRPGKLLVPDSDAGRAFAQLFATARGFVVECATDFESVLWHKLALNAVCGGICALTIRRNEVLADAHVRALAVKMMHEVITVGEAQGAHFPADYIDRTLAMIAGPVAQHWTSIAADRRNGLPLEWEVRNAVVGELGRQHGIPTPLMDMVTTLLRVAK